MVFQKGVLIFGIFVMVLNIVSANIYINEFTVDPKTDWGASGGITSSDEFFELYNNGGLDIDLNNWKLILNDSTNEEQNLSGNITAGGFFVMLNPAGIQNNDGQLILYDDSGTEIDKVTYGNWDDGNVSDNAPDGNANDVNDECLSRITDGQDTDIDGDDFIKGICTFGTANSPLINTTIEFGNKSINSYCIVKDDNVTLYVNVSHSDSIDVTFSVEDNGDWKNYSGVQTINRPGNYSSIIDTSLLGYGNHSWTVFVKDILNQTHQDGTHDFYVNRRTILNISPSNPDGMNGWYNTKPIFSLINNDGINLYYRWNSLSNVLYTSPFSVDGTPNNGNVTGGIQELNYFANFSCGKIESENSKVVYLDFFNPKIFDMNPEGEILSNNPIISASLDEVYQSNSGLNLSSVKMYLDNVEVDFELNSLGLLDAIISFNSSNLSMGTHEVKVYAEDYSGRSSMKTWEFEVVVPGAFNLVVNEPNQSLYNDKRIKVNISSYGDVKEISYVDWSDKKPRKRTLCRKNCEGYGDDKIKRLTFKDGFHEISFFAFDGYGMMVERNVSFLVDSKSPKIKKTEPRKGFSNGMFYLEFDEDNPIELNLYYENDSDIFAKVFNLSECNYDGRYTTCNENVDLSFLEGQEIFYYFNLIDINNKSDLSRIINLNVDTLEPVVNGFNFTLDGRKVNFLFNVSDLNFDKITYVDFEETSPREKLLCNKLIDYGDFGICENKKSFRRGVHNLTINIYDEAGNFEEISGVWFEVV